MDYEQLFWKKEHYITIRSRNGDYPIRKLVFNNNQLIKTIKNQKQQTDIYITKYPKDRILSVIILDFDNEEDKTIAYREARKLKNYLKTKGLNTVIVSSGKKGYHTYTQIPPTAFSKKEFSTLQDKDYNLYFELYVKELINYDNMKYETLDERNTNAGLGGIIRLIGSIHPSTNNKCEIIEGSFNDFQVPNQYHLDCLKLAHKLCNKIIEEKKKRNEERMKKVNKKLKEGFKDPVEENDLRQLMPELFPGKNKEYNKGYLYMQCPFHPDEHPSLLVTKEYFSCSACGEKGNIWTLKKKGHVDFNEKGVLV